jgi:hypothetical protein
VARSSGTTLGIGTQWLDRTSRQSRRSFVDSVQWKYGGDGLGPIVAW